MQRLSKWPMHPRYVSWYSPKGGLPTFFGQRARKLILAGRVLDRGGEQAPYSESLRARGAHLMACFLYAAIKDAEH